MSCSNVQKISECFVKPQLETEQEESIHLSSWDIAMLSFHYIQKGLLFKNPQNSIANFMEKLKNALSTTLLDFYPLAGRFATTREENPHRYVVFVDCQTSPGAKLIQVKVTELKDGIFIGVSMNHAIGDGTSYWRFWENLSRNFESSWKISPFCNSPVVHNRWFPDGHDKIINLPFKHEDEFVSRFESPPLLERIFHFSSESIRKLKAKANEECKITKISSFQSLAALVWRSVTRSRNLPHDQVTSCSMVISNRIRLNPPIPENYFGNYIQTVKGDATVGKLLENRLGWAAMELHRAVTNHCDKDVRAWVEESRKTPPIYNLEKYFDPYCVRIGGSSRFNMYGSKFGMGKAIAIRSGYANKFDGKVMSYPGRDGGGSVDLEICLWPENMKAIESDLEFMSVVSVFS